MKSRTVWPLKSKLLNSTFLHINMKLFNCEQHRSAERARSIYVSPLKSHLFSGPKSKVEAMRTIFLLAQPQVLKKSCRQRAVKINTCSQLFIVDAKTKFSLNFYCLPLTFYLLRFLCEGAKCMIFIPQWQLDSFLFFPRNQEIAQRIFVE